MKLKFSKEFLLINIECLIRTVATRLTLRLMKITTLNETTTQWAAFILIVLIVKIVIRFHYLTNLFFSFFFFF